MFRRTAPITRGRGAAPLQRVGRLLDTFLVFVGLTVAVVVDTITNLDTTVARLTDASTALADEAGIALVRARTAAPGGVQSGFATVDGIAVAIPESSVAP